MNALEKALEFNWGKWLLGFFILFELFKWTATGIEWFFNKFGFETKKMRQKREKQEELERRLLAVEKAVEEIKDTSKHNVNMFIEHEHQVVGKFTGIRNEIVVELNKIYDALNAQKETDCAILRDRIASGMRYFSQNKDEHGNVHISFSDYENMEALFREYFAKGGNGAFKKMYDTEFRNFIIDR